MIDKNYLMIYYKKMELSNIIVIILVLLFWVYLAFFYPTPEPKDMHPMSDLEWEQLECTPNYMGGCD